MFRSGVGPAVRRTALIACSAVLAFGIARAEASSIQIQGSTLGCFGAGCTTFDSPVTSDNITFTGSSFDFTTSGAGSFSDIALGSYSRGNTTTSTSGSFSLQVTFTLPVGIGGSPSAFTAVISANNVNAPGVFDFPQTWQTFTYSNLLGSGSFDFMVSNDPSVPKNSRSIPLLGAVQNATFTPAPSVTPAPEPGSLALFGTGLLGAAALRRRRQPRRM